MRYHHFRFRSLGGYHAEITDVRSIAREKTCRFIHDQSFTFLAFKNIVAEGTAEFFLLRLFYLRNVKDRLALLLSVVCLST